MEIVGGTFAASHGRPVALYSTGPMQDFLETVTDDNDQKDLTSPEVIKAMIESSAGDTALLDYGIKIGFEPVYFYDIMSIDMPLDEKVEFLQEAIKSIPVELSLIEIQGDPESDLNKLILKECDCMILLVPPSVKSLSNWASFANHIPNCMAKYNLCVCGSQVNSDILSDKNMAKRMDLDDKHFYKYPYNIFIPKLSLSGVLDSACEKICKGEPGYVELRRPIYDILSFIFNRPGLNLIRSVEEWCK